MSDTAVDELTAEDQKKLNKIKNDFDPDESRLNEEDQEKLALLKLRINKTKKEAKGYNNDNPIRKSYNLQIAQLNLKKECLVYGKMSPKALAATETVMKLTLGDKYVPNQIKWVNKYVQTANGMLGFLGFESLDRLIADPEKRAETLDQAIEKGANKAGLLTRRSAELGNWGTNLLSNLTDKINDMLMGGDNENLTKASQSLQNCLSNMEGRENAIQNVTTTMEKLFGKARNALNSVAGSVENTFAGVGQKSKEKVGPTP